MAIQDYVQLPSGYFTKPSDNTGPYVQGPAGTFTLAGSGSSGGGAVTIADGADVTQGAIADAVPVAGAAGTVNAHLRAISRDVVAGTPGGVGSYTSETGSAVTISTTPTALGAAGYFDCRGFSTLGLQYKNIDGANALATFEIAKRMGSMDWVVTHNSASNFLQAPDNLLVDLGSDDDLDFTTLGFGKNLWLVLDVSGTDAVRIRTSQATSAGTADWVVTKE